MSLLWEAELDVDPHVPTHMRSPFRYKYFTRSFTPAFSFSFPPAATRTDASSLRVTLPPVASASVPVLTVVSPA